MPPTRSLMLLAAILGTTLVPHAWGGEDFTMPYQCKPQFHAQAQFTETTATYDLQGMCAYVDSGGNASSVWTFYGKGTFTAGTPTGKATEQYTFSSPQGNSEMLLSMNCFGDPWIDGGICDRNSLRIAWKGLTFPPLMDQFSPSGPIPPPFSASYLRRDPPRIQAYKAQRQTYLTQLQQERQAKISGLPQQVPGALDQTINAPYMPTILSPAEGAQFVRGGPMLLMVRAPEKDTLGNLVQIEFQLCVFDQAKNACNWLSQGIEGKVAVPDLLAGTYRLPPRIADKPGTWRLRVQRPADPVARTAAGYPSVWRRFVIVVPGGQTGPSRGPVFGR
ncbi:MAG: hypothetical protein KF814_05200 [Nitrospiraceae bacterium]|nr:hypothetical protein [Nitrospiraceae bacterium]